jgi:hypothetical protein
MMPVTHAVNSRDFVGDNVGSSDRTPVRVGLDGKYISDRLLSSPGRHQPVSP